MFVSSSKRRHNRKQKGRKTNSSSSINTPTSPTTTAKTKTRGLDGEKRSSVGSSSSSMESMPSSSQKIKVITTKRKRNGPSSNRGANNSNGNNIGNSPDPPQSHDNQHSETTPQSESLIPALAEMPSLPRHQGQQQKGTTAETKFQQELPGEGDSLKSSDSVTQESDTNAVDDVSETEQNQNGPPSPSEEDSNSLPVSHNNEPSSSSSQQINTQKHTPPLKTAPAASKSRPPYSPSSSSPLLQTFGNHNTSSSSSTKDLSVMLRQVEEQWQGMSSPTGNQNQRGDNSSSGATNSHNSNLLGQNAKTDTNSLANDTSSEPSHFPHLKNIISQRQRSLSTASNTSNPSIIRFQQDNILVCFHTIDSSISFEVEYKYQNFEAYLTEADIRESDTYLALEQQFLSEGKTESPTVQDIFTLLEEDKQHMQILNIAPRRSSSMRIAATAGRTASPSSPGSSPTHYSSTTSIDLSPTLDHHNFQRIDKIILKIYEDWYIECNQPLESDLEKRIRVAESWILSTGQNLSQALRTNAVPPVLEQEMHTLKEDFTSRISELEHSMQSWKLQQNLVAQEDQKKHVDQTRDKISSLEKTVEEIAQHPNQLREEFEANISGLHTVIESFADKLKDINQHHLGQYKKLSGKIEGIHTSDSEKITSLSKQVTQQQTLLDKKLSKYQKSLEELTQSLKHLQTQHEGQKIAFKQQLSDNNKLLKDEFYENHEWIQNSLKENTQKECAKLEEQLGHLSEKYGTLKGEKDTLEENMSTLEEKYTTLEKDYSSLKDDHAALKLVVEQIQERQKSMENQQASMQESMQQQQTDIQASIQKQSDATNKRFILLQTEGMRYKTKLKKIARKLPYIPASFGFCESRKHRRLEICLSNQTVRYGYQQHAEKDDNHGSPRNMQSLRRSPRKNLVNMKWVSCLGDVVWTWGVYRFSIKCERGDSNWRIGVTHPDVQDLEKPVGSLPSSIALQVSNQTVYLGSSDEKIDLDYPLMHRKDVVSVTVDFTTKTLSYEVNGKSCGIVSTNLKPPLVPCVSMMVPEDGSMKAEQMTMNSSKWRRSLSIVGCEKLVSKGDSKNEL